MRSSPAEAGELGVWSGTPWGPALSTHLPEQHSQQQEDEDSHQQADGNDPPHDVASGLQIVQRLEDHLGGKAEVRWFPNGSTHRLRGPSLGLTLD